MYSMKTLHPNPINKPPSSTGKERYKPKRTKVSYIITNENLHYNL